MKSSLAIVMICLLGLCAQAMAGEALPRHEETFRNVSISVPKLAKAPTIDGTVGEEEWAGAGTSPRLIAWEKGDLMTDGQSRFFFGYTDDAFYLAWQIQRPKGAIAPHAVITEPDKMFWRTDDAIEFMLNCTAEGKARKSGSDFYMNWNALGTKFDRRLGHGQNMYDMKWTGPWKAVSRTAPDFGWEGEAIFPLSMLENAEKPGPGAIWIFQLCENRATPEAAVSLLGYQINWFTSVDYPSMLFTGTEGVVTRVIDCGAMAETGRSGLILELYNPGTAPRTVVPKLSLLKHKANAASTVQYLRAFDQSRDRPDDIAGKGKVALFLPDDKVSHDLVEENYDTIKSLDSPVTLQPGERKRIDMTVSGQSGNFLAFYDVRYAAGQAPKGERQLIAGAPVPYQVPEELAVTTRNFMLVDQTISVSADLRYVESWDTKGTLSAKITPKGDPSKTVFEKQWPGEGKRSALSFEVSTKGVAPGEYSLQIAVADAAGKQLAKREETLTVPSTPEWIIHPVGLAPVIPPPWKPIEVAGTKLSFLKGEYELRDSALPAAINIESIFDTQREPALRAPISLHGVVDGKPVEWRGPVKLPQQHEELVRAVSTATAGKVTVETTTDFEYDGMQKVVLKISPAEGAPAVTDFTLSIPMSKDFAQLYQTIAAQLRQEKVMIKNGSLPAGKTEHDWRPMIWLGNSRRGLEWFTENWKGWRVSAENDVKTIEIENGPDGATLNVHFILMDAAKPLLLDKPRQITFGLMFTPARSINREAVRHGAGYYAEGVPKQNSQYYSGELAAGVNAVEVWNNYDTQGWPDLTPERAAELKHWGEKLHADGIKITPYSGWYIHRKAQVYPTWGAQMLTEPATDAGCGCDVCCWNSPVTDAFLWQFHKATLEAGYDGYRLDAGFSVAPCSSLKHHGVSECGWIDDFGNLQPSLAIFAAREGAKRMYRMFHGGDLSKDGLCIIPPTQGCKLSAVLSFFDAGVSAEGAERSALAIKDFDLAYWRAALMEDRRGLQLIYWPKTDTIGRDTRLGIGQLHRLTPRGGGLVSTSEQSYSRCARPVSMIWKAEDWVRWLDAGTQFFGYWENKQYLDTGNPEVYGSIHFRKGERILLSMLSRERHPLETTVKLNMASMGFSEKAYAIDPILQEPVEIKDGKITTSFTAEGFRMVEISSQPFTIPNPKKISENLIPEAETTKWPANGAPAEWKLEGEAKDIFAANGLVTFTGDIETNLHAHRTIQLTPGKHYVLELEAHLECTDGVYLSPSSENASFGAVFGDYYFPTRTLASQLLPGRTETFKIYYTPPEASKGIAHVRIWLKGNGKAVIHRVGIYEVDIDKPLFSPAQVAQQESKK